MESKLTKSTTYRNWENVVLANMQILKDTIHTYKDKGYKLVGYGAAAKGNTLLNFTNLNLDMIIDDSPLKQGLYTPGSSIPVVSVDELDKFSENDKILFMPLAWNFFFEIRNKIKNKRDNKNDIFVKYFPKVEIANV